MYTSKNCGAILNVDNARFDESQDKNTLKYANLYRLHV